MLRITARQYKYIISDTTPEAAFQRQCEQHLDRNEIKYIHLTTFMRRKTRCPNCAKWHTIDMAVPGNKGVWDFIIFTMRGTLFVELKVGDNQLTPEQSRFRDELCGAYTFIELHDEKENDLFSKFVAMVEDIKNML